MTTYFGWLLTLGDIWLWVTFDFGWLLTLDDFWLWVTFNFGWLLTLFDFWLWVNFELQWLLTCGDFWFAVTFDFGSCLLGQQRYLVARRPPGLIYPAKSWTAFFLWNPNQYILHLIYYYKFKIYMPELIIYFMPYSSTNHYLNKVSCKLIIR